MPGDVAITCAHLLQLKAMDLRRSAQLEDETGKRLLLEKADKLEHGAEALYALIQR